MVVVVVVAGSQLPAILIWAHLPPGPVLIVISWVVGLALIGGARRPAALAGRR